MMGIDMIGWATDAFNLLLERLDRIIKLLEAQNAAMGVEEEVDD